VNDPLDDMYEEPSRDWIFPAGADRGFFMMGTGFGAALYGISTIGASTILGPFTIPVSAALVAGGMVMTDRGYRAWRHGSRAVPSGVPEDMFPMDGDMDMYGAPQVLYVGGKLHADVERVLQVAESTFGEDLYPVWSEFEVADGVLMKYGFRAAKPGYFTDDGVQKRVSNKLLNAVEASKGTWNPEFDVKDDTLKVSQRSSFPKIALPPHWKVVSSEQEARDFYPDFEYEIGIGPDGAALKFAPGNGFPHMGMYGTTGGGKSVTTRAIVEQFRAAGFQMYFCDGKGTDYTSMMREKGVIAVGSTLQEQVAVVHMVRLEMNRRRIEGAKKAKAGDATWRSHQTPLVLILDEFATTVNDMKSKYPKTFKAFMGDIAAILKVGREMRCHVILATQDMKAETVPSDWQAMLAVNVCMGKPDNMILNKAFPEAIRGQARLKGDTISKKTRGRGIVAVTKASGEVTVELFQSYYSYSPAEDISIQSGEVQKSWTAFKSVVTDRIPRLYSRVWFKPAYPEPEDGEKDPYAKLREKFEADGEDGRVDMEELDVLDIHKLEFVALEDRDGNVINGRGVFDPLNDAYLAGESLTASGNTFSASFD